MVERVENWLQTHPRLSGFILVATAFLVYAGSLANGFVYDDEYQVLQNPFVTNPHLWTRIFTGSVWSFQGVAFPTNYYRPLHIFTHWLIYRLAGPNPAAFHLFQILMYAATVWLVFQLGRKLLRQELAAFAGALLWALHPLHVEAVAWIAAVPDTGYGFFYLSGFLLFLRAEESEDRRLGAYALAALAYFPALLFKEMAFSFLPMLLAYWFFISPPETRSAWRRCLIGFMPFVLAVAICLMLRVAALGYVTQAANPCRITPRIAGAALGLLGQHTKLFFWPTHLNVFRSFELGPALHSPWPWLVIATLLGTLWLRKRQPVVSFLIAWWVVGLLPCLDIRQLSFPLLAERFSYLPSVGLCLALAGTLLVWLPRRLPAAQPERVTLPALAVAMVFCSVETLRAIPNWHDNETLANYSLRQSPNAALLHLIQALVLQYQHGDLDGAAREYQTAMRLNWASIRPLSKVTYDSYIGLGQIAYLRGRTEEALESFRKAVRVSPHDSPAYDVLGSVYFPRGDYARAAEYFSQAVRANPQDLSGRFYLGTCLLKLGRPREAAEQFRAARQVDPTFRQAYEAEARALEAAGDAAEAARVRGMIPAPD
ncbi:MAG: tetratricopeptide repeat protein [Acidobacteriia bacterium]|nr:tetratricopeptide repeat protein [Terriglobia bacterium]